MSLYGCVTCGKNIHDFVMIPNSPDALTQSSTQSSYAPPSSYEKDSRAWEFTTQPKSTKKLCERCNAMIATRLDDLLSEATEEYRIYEDYIAKLEQQPYVCEDLPIDEALLLQDVENIAKLRTHITTEISYLRSTHNKLEEQEEEYWQTINKRNDNTKILSLDWSLAAAGILEGSDYLGDSYHPTVTNKVYADAFQISVAQGLGVINNLRLGRLPGVTVDWDEINAAWGQTALLLYTLAKKLSFCFTRYKLIPMGFRPSIQHKDTRVLFPLYGSNSIAFGRPFFWGASSSAELDSGMEAFLFCVSELCARVLSLSATIALPYFIDKDKIGTRKGGLRSVRIGANSETDWSKALKYMLTNLKRILVSLPSLVHENTRSGPTWERQ